MKRLLLFLLFPTLALAQTQGTQFDRIDARGQVKTDKFINRATIIIAGATPDVSNGNVFKTNNPGTITVTNFLNGSDTQLITVNCGDANTTIQNNSNIVNTSGSDFVCGVNKTISYIYDAAQVKWIQSGTGSGGGGGGTPGTPNNAVQVNRAGVFTGGSATDDGTNFGINVATQFKGPTPYYDLGANGGSVSTASTTASCTSGSPNVTLAATQDFVNGQGIVIYQCGAATTLSTPVIPVVTSTVIGSTTYSYCAIAEDRLGGLTSCGATGTTVTGPAVLGRPGSTINLTQVVNSGGVATYTCSGNCNIANDIPVLIAGFASLDSGVRTVTSIPNATTFTTFTANTDGTTVTAATMRPFSANILNFSSYSGNNTLRYWIYRNGALAGVAVGLDPYFVDCGQGVGNVNPAYVPSTPPGAPQNGYLESSILSGGGTVNLILSTNAGASTSGQTVLHDNAVPLLNLMQTAFYNNPASQGPPIFIPSGTTFNGTLDMVNGISTGGFTSAKLLIGGVMTLNQPWIMRSGVRVDGTGAATTNTSFQADSSARINLNSHPGFYISGVSAGGGAGGFKYSNLFFLASVSNPYTAIYSDINSLGNGVNGLTLTNINATQRGAPSIILKGAFGDIINGGAISGDFFTPAIRLTNSSAAVTGANNSQTPGNTIVDGTFLGSVGVQNDCIPNPVHCVGGGVVLKNALMETVAGPMLAFYQTGSQVNSGVSIENSQMADFQVGGGTPVLDAGRNTTLNIVVLKQVYFGQTLFLGTSGNVASGASTTVVTESVNGASSPVPMAIFGAGQTLFSNQSATATGTGRFIYPITTPGAPVSATVSAGGAVPTGTYSYEITVLDLDGFESLAGPPITGIVVTGGNQTVTVTRPTLPAGSTSWYILRSNGGGFARVFCGAAASSQTTQTDNQFFSCGNSAPNTSQAAITSLGSNGVSTNSLRIAGGGFTSTLTPGTLTANRSNPLPDGAGPICVQGACAVNGVTINGDAALTSSPRAVPPVFFPGALTTTWTGASWTLDKAITVTRVQSAAKVVPAGCSTSAIIRVTDGSTPINLTINAATNDSGVITQSYAAGATLTVGITTAASGCTTSPGDVNLSIQSRMN